MPKLLIADDDQYIRNGLKELIDWENLGIEIVGEAEGGREAYEIFLREGPQLVLTDIRMPDGDGLELMERIREKDWNTHLIVLSGYDDYSYVRQAMKFQVEDYLLKPVDPGELEEIAKACIERIESRWMDERIRRETFQLLRNNVLNRWIENRIEDEQLREKLSFLKIEVGHVRLVQAAVIGWQDAAEGELPEAERHFRSFAIYNAMDELLMRDGRGTAFLNAERQIVCLLFGAGKDAEVFADANLEWLRAAAEKCAALLKTPWYGALGKPADRLHLVHGSYGDALRLLDGMEQTGPVRCADRRELEAESRSGRKPGDRARLDSAPMAGRREAARELPTHARNPLTIETERYLREHYREELTLQKVAGELHVSPIYLGRLFKAETGDYFSDYLNGLRLEEAKRQLAETRLKASEIATRCGFSDSNYFFRKFKMKVGLSPTEYRAAVKPTDNR